MPNESPTGMKGKTSASLSSFSSFRPLPVTVLQHTSPAGIYGVSSAASKCSDINVSMHLNKKSASKLKYIIH